ncbi:hypothetical protein L3Q82_019774 [Scortum barcoo]|uniref:Uncharacterized protein n=1 Tax=Scortum barcoo TaxID=214431 RepID=A0ACB8VCZ4_9TELE|nr:hypothetical protein L3Q82_019774 [Scortum barcoo]
MTRAALTKLIILVILAFIICLSEFFTLYRELKVNFHCLPYRPCELENQMNARKENGKTGSAEIREKDMCNPAHNPERVKSGSSPAHKTIKATRQILKRAGLCVKLIRTWQNYTAACHLQVSHSL